jgi:hypothetical protein
MHGELFQRLRAKPFWIWDKQQHKLEDVKTLIEKSSLLNIGYKYQQMIKNVTKKGH